ncbi:hypothetical protein COW46_02180 [Candidatus Gracilibacteria bacterium CG17_big_fil_post_rev_8_21_14_2_50_48_13]|nr:MAG: hypothetical protein COW46_02180 [Candidatus Gracilibacteria bacterium CG17_big_fil_post_rev_8_21_14_2_50_48_13]
MKKPHFVLINGRGGVGKTTTLHRLLEHPPQGWIFFDFDDGKFPPPRDGESGKEWRRQQHNWWLSVAKAWHGQNMHVCVLGVGIFPWQVPELEAAQHFDADQFAYGVMTCSPKTRRARLLQRGTTQIAEYDEEQARGLLAKMKAHGAVEFSTEEKTPEEVAEDIRAWLNSLSM